MGRPAIPARSPSLRRLPSVLALAAVSATGCATGFGPLDRSPPPGLIRMDAPVGAPAASAWSDFRPSAPIAPAPPGMPARPGVGGVWISHVSILGGGRWLDEEDWGTLDKQPTVGLEVDESYAASGHGYEAGLLYTEDEDDFESTVYELYGGYRYTFGAAEQDLHPFVSLGLTAMQGDFELSGPGFGGSDDDLVLGAYVRAGLLWDVSERVRLGLDYRRCVAEDFDVELAGSEFDADADYDQVVISLGFEF